MTRIDTAWGTLMTTAALKNFRLHDCRHHFASKLVQAGVDLYTVKELLGHSEVAMTEKFSLGARTIYGSPWKSRRMSKHPNPPWIAMNAELHVLRQHDRSSNASLVRIERSASDFRDMCRRCWPSSRRRHGMLRKGFF